VLRIQEKRNEAVFPLIRVHLEKSELPVKDIDHITCWENVEFALLTLPEPQFEPILADVKKKMKEKADRLLDKRSVAHKDEYAYTDAPERNEAIQDDWIKAMEAEFDRGNTDNLKSLLERYDSKE